MRYSSDVGTGQRSWVDFFVFLNCFIFKLSHRIQANLNTVIDASSLHKHNSRFGTGIPLRFAKNNSHLKNFAIMIELSTSGAQICNKFFLEAVRYERKENIELLQPLHIYFYLRVTLHYIFTTDGKLGKMVNRR